MKNKITISTIAAIIALIGGVSWWYLGYYKSTKQLKTCETLAFSAFQTAFGGLDELYEICKINKLQEIYAETYSKEGIEGASLGAHKKVYNLCECAVKDFAKNMISSWIEKCVKDDPEWLTEPLQIRKRFTEEHNESAKTIYSIIELGYRVCDGDY